MIDLGSGFVLAHVHYKQAQDVFIKTKFHRFPSIYKLKLKNRKGFCAYLRNPRLAKNGRPSFLIFDKINLRFYWIGRLEDTETLDFNENDLESWHIGGTSNSEGIKLKNFITKSISSSSIDGTSSSASNQLALKDNNLFTSLNF